MMTKSSAWKWSINRGILIAVSAGILFTGSVDGFAQTSTTLHGAKVQAATVPLLGADGRPVTFDVVSVREDKSIPSPEHPPEFGPTSDGYHLRNLTVIVAILAAYTPSQGGDTGFFSPDQISGVPTWLSATRYDINARISEADLSKWKNPVLQPAMLRTMLQGMLADRFKIAVHRELKEYPVYELTVAKSGVKFKPSEKAPLTDIQQKYPKASEIVGGTIIAQGAVPGQVMLFGATMQVLCQLLSQMAGRPVQDKTGLTGKYDITYQIELPERQEQGSEAAESLDFNSQIFTVVQDQLGLRLTKATGSVEMLVIDHVERPSEN